MNKYDVDYTESFTRTILVAMLITIVGIFATRQIAHLNKSTETTITPTVNAETKSNE